MSLRVSGATKKGFLFFCIAILLSLLFLFIIKATETMRHYNNYLAQYQKFIEQKKFKEAEYALHRALEIQYTDQVWDMMQAVDEIAESEEIFQKAVKAEQEGEYALAIELFNRVSNKDTNNYAIAERKRIELHKLTGDLLQERESRIKKVLILKNFKIKGNGPTYGQGEIINLDTKAYTIEPVFNFYIHTYDGQKKVDEILDCFKAEIGHGETIEVSTSSEYNKQKDWAPEIRVTTKAGEVRISADYIGDEYKWRLHNKDCQFAQLPKISPGNMIYFSRKEDALSSGFEPCSFCIP